MPVTSRPDASSTLATSRLSVRDAAPILAQSVIVMASQAGALFSLKWSKRKLKNARLAKMLPKIPPTLRLIARRRIDE